MILSRVECAHDRYNLACELDSFYGGEDYQKYIENDSNFGDIICPWMRVVCPDGEAIRYAWIRCSCYECTWQQRADYARVMTAEEYDYHYE